MEEKIKVLLVNPYELPKEVEIDNTLKAEQQMVKGNIECVYLPNNPDVVLICNEEGKINGMKCNRDIGYDIIFGPFLVVGDDRKGNFTSLTEEQMINYKIKFDRHSIHRTIRKMNEILLNKYKDSERGER